MFFLAKFGFDTAENEPDLIFLIFLPPRDLVFLYASHPPAAEALHLSPSGPGVS